MKVWNVYAVERRKGGRTGTKFVGEIRADLRRLKRAAADVSKKAGVALLLREAATDNWRRPG